MVRRNTLIVTIFALLLTGYGIFFYFNNIKSISIGIAIKDYYPPRYKDYYPPKYNESKSITYKKSYNALSKELLYARVIIIHPGNPKETVRLIRDKQKLIQIVRGFDKLKSTMPKGKDNLEPDKEVRYVITMWREGTSVSYVIIEYNSEFYYRESPYLPLKHMPNELVELLGFNNVN